MAHKRQRDNAGVAAEKRRRVIEIKNDGLPARVVIQREMVAIDALPIEGARQRVAAGASVKGHSYRRSEFSPRL